MMILEWSPLGKAQDEESILAWTMQEHENLDIVMEEAEGRRRQDDAKRMKKEDTEVLEDDTDYDDVKIDETDQETYFEEWVVREVTELGYNVNTSDWVRMISRMFSVGPGMT